MKEEDLEFVPVPRPGFTGDVWEVVRVLAVLGWRPETTEPIAHG